MPVHLSWDLETPNVVRYEFEWPWTWQQFREAFDRECMMARELAGRRYDIIGAFAGTPRLPAGPGVTHVYNAYRKRPSNAGFTVVVTTNAFVRALIEVLYKSYPHTRGAFLVVPSVEEARQRIMSARELITP